jgi:hypothetical protein
MKKLKEIDVGIQVSLIVAAFLYGFIVADYRFIFGYFAVGGWQLLSCFFHATTRYPYLPSPARRIYLRTLAWTLAIGLLSIAVGVFFFLFALLFVSPFYAVWYTVICIGETEQLRKRAFIQLR